MNDRYWWENDPEVQREARSAEARQRAAEQAQIDAEVEHSVNRMYIRYLAEQEFRKKIDPPERAVPMTAQTILETLPPEQPDRVSGFLKHSQGTLLTAKAGAGKTALAVSLTRSLLTGEPFLGKQETVPLEDGERVAWLSYDMSSHQLLRWMQVSGIDLDRVLIVDQHGRGNPLMDDETRSELAQDLASMGCRFIVCDAFGAAYWGVSQNDAAEVKQFYRTFEQFVRQACGGLCEYLMIAHAGHEQSKGARGSTAIGESVGAIFAIEKNDQSGVRKLKSLKFRTDIGNEELPAGELYQCPDTGLVSWHSPTPAGVENEDGTIDIDFSKQEISEAQERRDREKEQIFILLSEGGPANRREIMESLDWPDKAAVRAGKLLREMVAEGALLAEGEGPSRRWKTNPTT